MLLPKSVKLNGLVVIVISLISYYFSTSITALIPSFFGLFLIILHLYDKNNKLIAHIAVLLILLLLLVYINQ